MRTFAILSVTVLAALLLGNIQCQTTSNSCKSNADCKTSGDCCSSTKAGDMITFMCIQSSLAGTSAYTCMGANDNISTVCGTAFPVACTDPLGGNYCTT